MQLVGWLVGAVSGCERVKKSYFKYAFPKYIEQSLRMNIFSEK